MADIAQDLTPRSGIGISSGDHVRPVAGESFKTTLHALQTNVVPFVTLSLKPPILIALKPIYTLGEKRPRHHPY